MILLPAIDIYEGRAVRLVQGRFEDATTYHDDPLEAALAMRDAGARGLHVVDLDGAKSGAPVNLDHVERIVRETGLPVQLGGGLRSVEAVDAALATGVERIVVGTAAFTDVDFLDAVVAAHGVRVVVSVDTRGGFVSTAGWTHTTELPAPEVIGRLQARGVSTFVCTNVDVDGMLEGPDLEEVARIADAVRGHWIYSGGIGTLEHLRILRGLRRVNLAGVIAGKAIYERRFTVAEGQAVLDGE